MDNLGGLAEDAAQAAVERALGADFVFRSPRKESDGKEVTDLLVLYDNLVIILQVKSMERKPDGAWRDDDLGWARKHLSKALRQVNGAARHLKANASTRIESPRRGKVDFDKAAFPHVIGLVVLNHPPIKFRPEISDEYAKLAVPTHVVSLNDLLNLALYGDSIPEEKFRMPGDFLRSYIRDRSAYAAPAARFDHIIESLHEHDRSIPKPRLPEGATIEVRNDTYIEAATALARYPRAKRVALGRRIMDLIKDAQLKRTSLSFQTYNPRTRTSLVVLATQHNRNQRQERAEELMVLTLLAKQANQAELGVGVATEGRLGKGRSYDLSVYKAPPTPDPVAEKLAGETWSKSGRLGEWLL